MPVATSFVPDVAGKQGSIGVFIGSSTVDVMAPMFSAAKKLKAADANTLIYGVADVCAR